MTAFSISVSLVTLLQSELVASVVLRPSCHPSLPLVLNACSLYLLFTMWSICPPVILKTENIGCSLESVHVWKCVLPPYLIGRLVGYKTLDCRLFSIRSLEIFSLLIFVFIVCESEAILTHAIL